MMTLPETITLPLRVDEYGAIRVSNTRIVLGTLLEFYRQGYTAEALHDAFPTVPLADMHTIIGYYLTHQPEMDSYLEQRNADHEALRQEVEARNPPPTLEALRARLAARTSE